jgi:hypothetical protein
MHIIGRLAHLLGIAVLTASVALAGLQFTPGSALSRTHAAGLPPLAGYWFSSQASAPIGRLRIAILNVLADGEPSGSYTYSIDALARGRELGTQNTPVPSNAAAPVTVTYTSSRCVVAPGTLCKPTGILDFTALTLARSGQFLHVRVTIRFGALVTTSAEVMTHLSL